MAAGVEQLHRDGLVEVVDGKPQLNEEGLRRAQALEDAIVLERSHRALCRAATTAWSDLRRARHLAAGRRL